MIEKGSATRLLVLVVAAHFLVDTVASVINPLWPTLKEQTGCGAWGFFALYLMWNVVNSCTQMLFGLLGERFGGRWMIWAGPTVAILSLSLLGYVSSPWALGILTMLAGMGIAAFHPEAATAAGNSLPEHRSRAMSLFQIGGYLGQTAGPYYSGQVVAHAGTPGLMPGMLWMLVVVAALRWGLSEPATEGRAEKKSVVSWAAIFKGRITTLLVILGIGVLRIMPAAGIPLALAFLETSRHSNTADIGLVQSAFTFGIGGGGLLCALFVRPRHESWLLWLLPLFSAPLMMAIPAATAMWLLMCAAATGVLLGIPAVSDSGLVAVNS